MTTEVKKFDSAKTKQLITYLASKVDIGKTKLMKLLYFIDFIAYERTGHSVTNDEYRHWALGAVPVTIWRNLDEIVKGRIVQEYHDRGNGYTYIKYIPKRDKVNTPLITKDEKQIIDEVISQYGGKNQAELVDVVHKELPYKMTKDNEVIPSELAPYRNYKTLTVEQVEKIKSNNEFMGRLQDAYDNFQSVSNGFSVVA